MKLLDKFKDLFMDDVIEEEEVDALEEENDTKIYQEPKKDILPKVMREELTEEENKILPKEKSIVLSEEPKKLSEESKKIEETRKMNFTFDLNEIPSRESRNNDLFQGEKLKNNKNSKETVINQVNNEKKKSDLYPTKEENWVKPKFKASPVISPVYGVLDKNYKKEEVKEKVEEKVSLKRPSKKVDFETVRKKAFGNLSDEIRDNMCENCELYKEALKNNTIQEDNLLYDMTLDDDKKEETIEKAYNNYEEFGVAYEPKVEKVEVLNSEEEFKNNEVIEEEKIPTRESLKEEKKDNVKVDADFFELIDSMYKERSDD